MKKIIAVILSALTLCTATACSSGSSSSSKADSSKANASDEVTPDTDFYTIDEDKLPSKVDLRNFEGKNYVTPVKRQSFGDCWAFSLAGAAEISYLYESGMGVPAGQVNDKVDFSEKYITWYIFHGITKDDAVKGKVRASQVGEGFDPSKAEEENNKTVYFIGGPFVHDSNLFGAGFGPVDEKTTIKGEQPFAYDDESSFEWSLPLNAEYRNAPASAFIRNSIKLPSPAKTEKNGSYTFNKDGLLAIKSELSKGHGVSFAYCSGVTLNFETKAAYNCGGESADHAVTIVGYDDDFAKENFKRKYANGKEMENSIPPENGAFIVKNSWGLADENDDGYFYLSYYDQSIESPLSFVFDSSESTKHTTLNYDQYDLLMTEWYGSTDYSDETKMANVFDAEEDENLFQIAYATGSEKTEVTYEIYKDVDDDDPSSGTLLEKGINRHTYKGFFKIDLKDEYELKKGDKYSVVLTMKRVTNGDGDMTYTEVFPYSTEFFRNMTVRGVVNEGESFLYSDGKWSDMTASKDSLIDRAFEQGAKEINSMRLIEGMGIELHTDSKDSFTVDNYPIKAISSPAE